MDMHTLACAVYVFMRTCNDMLWKKQRDNYDS